jgi:hypothetical protein
LLWPQVRIQCKGLGKATTEMISHILYCFTQGYNASMALQKMYATVAKAVLAMYPWLKPQQMGMIIFVMASLKDTMQKCKKCMQQ